MAIITITLEHGGEGSDTSLKECKTSVTSLEILTMLPKNIGDANTRHQLHYQTLTDSESTNHILQLQGRLIASKRSDEASDLLLASWRNKTRGLKTSTGHTPDQGSVPLVTTAAKIFWDIRRSQDNGLSWREPANVNQDGHAADTNLLLNNRVGPTQCQNSSFWHCNKETKNMPS